MKFTEYPHGTPCWIDLGSTDVAASTSFYSRLFGWTPHTSPDPQFGGYVMLHLGDDAVAGLGPVMSPDQPTRWLSYLAVDDADAAATAVDKAGGSVLAPPFDVGDVGRMALCTDPAGATFGLWQKLDFAGAQLANEPGSWCWSELRTPDPAAAAGFYGTVFGMGSEVTDMGTMPYTSLKVGDKTVAGAMPMGDLFPPGTPAHWAVYFAVEDADASAAKAVELGARQLVPAMEAEGVGRWIALQDPQGAEFSVIRM